MQPKFVIIVEFGQDSSRRISAVLQRLEIKHLLVRPSETPSMNPTHIILSGGPKHVYENDHYAMPAWIFHTQAPVLAICYGMQLLAHTLGGFVRRMPQKEEGPIEVIEMIGGKQTTKHRWMNRNDQVVSVPKQFKITGVTVDNHIAAFTDNIKWWAIQYHPEASKCRDTRLFRRFLRL